MEACIKADYSEKEKRIEKVCSNDKGGNMNESNDKLR